MRHSQPTTRIRVVGFLLATRIEYTTRCRLRSPDCCCSADVCAIALSALTPTYCDIPYETLVNYDWFKRGEKILQSNCALPLSRLFQIYFQRIMRGRCGVWTYLVIISTRCSFGSLSLCWIDHVGHSLFAYNPRFSWKLFMFRSGSIDFEPRVVCVMFTECVSTTENANRGDGLRVVVGSGRTGNGGMVDNNCGRSEATTNKLQIEWSLPLSASLSPIVLWQRSRHRRRQRPLFWM